MADDFCDEARALGVRVWDEGEPQWSERIDEIIAAGATPSEILMGIGWTLREMVEGEPDLPRPLRCEASDLIKRISRAL